MGFQNYPYILMLLILLNGKETIQELTTGPSAESKLNQLPADCGLQTVHDTLADTNGTRVFSYPWMAVVRHNGSTIRDGCTGSLINKRYVLTAGHCIVNTASLRLHSVVLGEHTKRQAQDCNVHREGEGVELQTECAEAVDEYGIESFEAHPDYSKRYYTNDIGLIRLDRDVTMKDHIRPICLPVTQELRAQLFDSYTVTSWNKGDVLLKAEVRHISNENCQEVLKKSNMRITLNDKQLCTESTAVICHGSGGGPLGSKVNYNGVRFVQFGIVSVGSRTCDQRNIPEVFTRVASYMDWVLDSIRS